MADAKPLNFEATETDCQNQVDIQSLARKAQSLGWGQLLREQKGKGDFEGEMVWCTMILAQSLIVRAIIGKPYTPDDLEKILLHFKVTQAEDGSWGMHPESQGYIFFTTLAYVSLRLSGIPPDEPLLARALKWLKSQTVGVKGIPTWGKFWLAILDLYPYQGLNAIPPELFLLPRWLPFHPGRFYCHTRLIYLGLAFISGNRFVARLDPNLVRSLREELYGEPYESIPFHSLRHYLAKSDVFVPISWVLKRIYDGLAIFERRPIKRLRMKALSYCYDKILFEQRSTQYQGISPVNGLLNTLALFVQDQNHPELDASIEGIEAWRWEDQDEGLRYVGARSNTWDTAFVLQAVSEITQPTPEIVIAMSNAHAFLDAAQLVKELPDFERYWRDSSVGGWCFSDGRHHWPVSDCTAEAVSGLIGLYQHPAYRAIKPLDPDRLRQAVRFILSRQNNDGGFGTYERRRAGRLLELVNPSEMFGQCMTELSYVECTASSLAALLHFRQHEPEYAKAEIDQSCQRAFERLLSLQRPDGSWEGFWGINYTYATFHVVRSLLLFGMDRHAIPLRRAANFICSIQQPDGGWGEHYSSCLTGKYVAHPDSQVVMTSWSLLALLLLLDPKDPAIEKGIVWLLSKQGEDGSWPRQAVNGVFFGAAMLDYRLYHTYFPVWAITRYNHTIDAVSCCSIATSVAKSELSD